MDIETFPDLDALSRGALEELLRILRDAVTDRGRFAVALAGGRTPARMYSLWAQQKYQEQTPWDRVQLFWGDERYVPHDDPRSNYRMARETLIAHVPIPASNVHPMPTDLPQPELAAEAYQEELRKFFGPAVPAFDVQLLGVGVEGHTASLFPGSPVLDDNRRWVAAVEVPAEPPLRLTLTPAVLNSGRNTFFLVAGEDKGEILEALRNEPETRPSRYPAGKIRPAGRTIWFLDQAVAH